MMRNALIVLGLLAVPTAAFAQTSNIGQGRLDMTGTAPSACVISAPTTVTGTNTSFALTGAQAAQITITQLVDQNTAQPLAATINLSLPVICNSAHTLTVTTANGGLARVGGTARTPVVTNGFREFVPYQVDTNWAGQSVNADSETQTPVNISVADGAAGDVNLTISVAPGGAPLVAGTYSDQLVIQLQVAS